MKTLWNTYGFYVLYANAGDVDPGAADGPATDLDRWILSRLHGDDRDRDRADGRLRHDDRGPRDRGVRRRPLELVRAALAAALLGRRPGRLLDAARVPRDGREAARAADAVRGRRDLREPRRLRAVGAPDRLPGGPSARATSSSSGRWRSRATPSSSAARRARTAKLKVRQPLREAVVVAADRERGGDRAVRAARARRAEREDRCASCREAEELGRFELKPNYRALGPRFGKRDAAGRGRGRGARRRRSAAATLRDGGTVGVNVDGKEHPLVRGRRPARAPAARGLPGRARRHARGRAQPRARRRARAARASRARWSTPSRTRARPPA